jgi:hypothetical protein
MVTKKSLNSSMHMDYLHISKIRSDKKKSIKTKSLKMSKFTLSHPPTKYHLMLKVCV